MLKKTYRIVVGTHDLLLGVVELDHDPTNAEIESAIREHNGDSAKVYPMYQLVK